MAPHAVLVVDHDPLPRRAIVRGVRLAGAEALEADSPGRALELGAERRPPLMLVDPQLSPERGARRGLELLCEVRRRGLPMDVAVVAGASDPHDQAAAHRAGARWYLSKHELGPGLVRALVDESAARARSASADAGLSALVGRSPAVQRLGRQIAAAAASDAPVLIVGETGSGKEVVARCIHDLSARAGRPFVVLDATTLPHSLAEASLFGHERGAFTDCREERAGPFEEVGAGTLLLDEIGDMALALQPKLLRVLEARTIQRVGSSRPRAVCGRIVAATHRCLERECDEGRFRRDLLYRLDAVRIDVPPLRERAEDVPLLLEHFARHHAGRSVRLTDGACARAMEHSWPGNVRELRNAVDRLVAARPGGVVDAEDFVALALRGGRSCRVPDASGVAGGAPLAPPPASTKEQGAARLVRERTAALQQALTIDRALRQANGNVSSVARELGLSRYELARLLGRRR